MTVNELLFSACKEELDKTRIKCKLVDCTAWHKVYIDIVFNEVFLYQHYTSVCLSVIEEPFISSTILPDKKSYFSFMLDTKSIYISDKKDIARLINDIDEKYAMCLQTYESVKSEIEIANKQYREMYDTNVPFKECHSWFLQKERELTNIIQDLSKIYSLC